MTEIQVGTLKETEILMQRAKELLRLTFERRAVFNVMHLDVFTSHLYVYHDGFVLQLGCRLNPVLFTSGPGCTVYTAPYFTQAEKVCQSRASLMRLPEYLHTYDKYI